MPYVANEDVTLQRDIAVGRDPEGNEYTETESFVAAEGQVVREDDLSADLKERLDDGDDDRLNSLLRHVSEEEAEEIVAGQQEGLAVIPEHEAEAQVLAEDGQDVLTREEVIDLNPNGDPPAAEEAKVDLSKGREPENPDSIRSTEVDAARRGDAPAPKGQEAAREGDAPDPDDVSKADLVEQAEALGISGAKSKNKQELADAIAEANATPDGGENDDSNES